jgi:hypothetical protein
MLLLASSVSAQTPIGTSARLGSSFMNLNTVEAAGEQRLTGVGIGGNGTVSYGRLGLGLRYLEGSLSPSGAGGDRDIVEGEATVSVHASSWLRFGLGPHIRSFVIPEGTERWFFWEGHVQARTQLGSPRLVSVLEFRQVLSADVDVDADYGSGQGITGELRWDVSALPIWLGLSYRIDRSSLGDGSRTEVMEHFVISIGAGRGAR